MAQSAISAEKMSNYVKKLEERIKKLEQQILTSSSSGVMSKEDLFTEFKDNRETKRLNDASLIESASDLIDYLLSTSPHAAINITSSDQDISIKFYIYSDKTEKMHLICTAAVNAGVALLKSETSEQSLMQENTAYVTAELDDFIFQCIYDLNVQ